VKFELFTRTFNSGDLVKDHTFGVCIFLRYESDMVAQVHTLRYGSRLVPTWWLEQLET